MQKDSIFRIYSMSKPITGVAMMMLFEEGKWQLNDPVAKYIPEFAGLKVFGIDANGNMALKDQTHPMTMRELMSHTAGFTYGFFSNTPVDKLQREADVLNVNNTLGGDHPARRETASERPARQRMALQHLGRHSGIHRAEALRHAVR